MNYKLFLLLFTTCASLHCMQPPQQKQVHKRQGSLSAGWAHAGGEVDITRTPSPQPEVDKKDEAIIVHENDAAQLLKQIAFIDLMHSLRTSRIQLERSTCSLSLARRNLQPLEETLPLEYEILVAEKMAGGITIPRSLPTRFPLLFTKLKLASLNLQRCNLTSLPTSLATLRLQELNLRENKFTTLPPVILSMLPLLIKLDLNDNPLQLTHNEYAQLAGESSNLDDRSKQDLEHYNPTTPQEKTAEDKKGILDRLKRRVSGGENSQG